MDNKMEEEFRSEDKKRPADGPTDGEPPQKRQKLSTEITKQFDFWFHDSNWRTDKFLRETAEKNDGWVPLTVLATFKRMQSLTQDLTLMASAIPDCQHVVLSEDGQKVKRKNLWVEQEDTSPQRSIFVQGLPAQEPTIEQVATVFSCFGTIAAVRLKHDKTKGWSRECFVEFETQEMSEKAVAAKEVKYDDQHQLSILSKSAWLEELEKKKADSAIKKQQKKDAAEIEKQKIKERKLKASGDLYQAGVLLEVKGVPVDYPRDDTKAFFSKFGRVRYADFKNPELGIVRFFEPESAKAALEKITAQECQIKDVTLVGRILEGEEETNYWKNNVEPSLNREDTRDKGGKRGRGRGGRGRGGRGRGGR